MVITYDKRLVEMELIKPQDEGKIHTDFLNLYLQSYGVSLNNNWFPPLISKLWDISYPEGKKDNLNLVKLMHGMKMQPLLPMFFFTSAKNQADAKTEPIVQHLTKGKAQQPVEPKVNSAQSYD